MTEKWGQNQAEGNGSLFELAGLFEFSEFELPGFYCTCKQARRQHQADTHRTVLWDVPEKRKALYFT